MEIFGICLFFDEMVVFVFDDKIFDVGVDEEGFVFFVVFL